MTHKIKLGSDDDRVVNIEVTDQHGEIYLVDLEFLNHHFEVDEVQVNVTKPGGTSKSGTRWVRSPNRILYDEEIVAVKKSPQEALSHGIWYEFHAIDDLPRVRSEAFKESRK